jgi:hypothetical protein
LDNEESLSPSPTSHGYDQGLWEHHAFLFRHNQSAATLDLHDYYPPSSQRPDLLDLFKKNINCMIQFAHMPAVSAMLHETRRDELRSDEEALMFSIYYATIASLEEDEVSHDAL